MITYTDEEIDEIIEICDKRPHSGVYNPEGGVIIDFDIIMIKRFNSAYNVKHKIPCKTFRRLLREVEIREAYIERTPDLRTYTEAYVLLFAKRRELPLYLNDTETVKKLALFRIRKAEKVKE